MPRVTQVFAGEGMPAGFMNQSDSVLGRVKWNSSRWLAINITFLRTLLAASVRHFIDAYFERNEGDWLAIIPLKTAGSFGSPGTFLEWRHPQQLTALLVQIVGPTNESPCTYCASENANTRPVFSECNSLSSISNNACGCCLARHNAASCSHCKFTFEIIESVLIEIATMTPVFPRGATNPMDRGQPTFNIHRGSGRALRSAGAPGSNPVFSQEDYNVRGRSRNQNQGMGLAGPSGSGFGSLNPGQQNQGREQSVDLDEALHTSYSSAFQGPGSPAGSPRNSPRQNSPAGSNSGRMAPSPGSGNGSTPSSRSGSPHVQVPFRPGHRPRGSNLSQEWQAQDDGEEFEGF